jgi:hypothetical protein
VKRKKTIIKYILIGGYARLNNLMPKKQEKKEKTKKNRKQKLTVNVFFQVRYKEFIGPCLFVALIGTCLFHGR